LARFYPPGRNRLQMTKKQPLKIPSRLGAYLFMIVNTITWGAALIIVKPGLDVTTPYRFLLYRYVLAAAIGLPILLYFWHRAKPSIKNIIHITLIELLGTTFTLWLLYTGLQRTSGIEASLLGTTQPLFITLVGVLLFKERLEKNESMGLTIAFLGTLVLSLVPLFTENEALGEIALLGNFLVIFSLILNGFYYPLTKKYYRQIPKLLASSLSFYVGLVSFAILSWVEAGFSFPALTAAIQTDLAAPSVVTAAIYMATFGSIIGYTALIKAMEVLEASEASLFNYLQPLIYLPLGMLMLNEGIHPVQIVALLVVFLGVLVAERKNYLRS